VRYSALAIVLSMIVLHQDWWNWRSVRPFIFGLPVGLWYHVGYTIAAAALMAILVRYFWPGDNEGPKDGDC
jgi:hypothetical protein